MHPPVPRRTSLDRVTVLAAARTASPSARAPRRSAPRTRWAGRGAQACAGHERRVGDHEHVVRAGGRSTPSSGRSCDLSPFRCRERPSIRLDRSPEQGKRLRRTRTDEPECTDAAVGWRVLLTSGRTRSWPRRTSAKTCVSASSANRGTGSSTPDDSASCSTSARSMASTAPAPDFTVTVSLGRGHRHTRSRGRASVLQLSRRGQPGAAQHRLASGGSPGSGNNGPQAKDHVPHRGTSAAGGNQEVGGRGHTSLAACKSLAVCVLEAH